MPFRETPSGKGRDPVRSLVIDVAIMIAVALALAALGPYGSFALGDYAARLAYWLPAALLGYAAFRPSYAGGLILSHRLDLPLWMGVGVGVLVGAIPATLLICWWGGVPLTGLDFPHQLRAYVQVALIGALVCFLFLLLERGTVVHPATVERSREMMSSASEDDGGSAAPSPPAPFLDRLPPDIASDLIALEMEDHYVRAHAPGRSTLLLMRMRDAELELASVEGMRVHRSWWVAKSGIEQVLRRGRSVRLKLRGGIEAPVARDRILPLCQAGWLD
jgi:hypothetical protein